MRDLEKSHKKLRVLRGVDDKTLTGRENLVLVARLRHLGRDRRCLVRGRAAGAMFAR